MSYLPPRPEDDDEHFISFRGSASVGVILAKGPLARIRINSATIRVNALGYEDQILKSQGDYVQHFDNWYAFDALRVVQFSGVGGTIFFHPAGAYSRIEAVLRANGWDICES